MEAYTSFAKVYDRFMDNVPYEEWCGYLCGLLKEYGIGDGLVLELGCGTGSMTMGLAGQGYDMIGIDQSGEMLEIARERLEVQNGQAVADGTPDILYLQQDMREFELYGTVRAVVSVCDSINYLLSEEELLQVFRLVNNYLDPGGFFIFDMNTIYKYEELIGDTTIAENRDEASFIWENTYFEEERINQYELTIFVREQQDLYRKFEETHLQKAYTLDCVKDLLEQAGMEFVAAYDAFTKKAPHEKSERIYLIAREHGKEETCQTI